MKYLIRLTVTVMGCVFFFSASIVDAQDLPSWQDGGSKTAIMSFVDKVTTVGGKDFVAPEERIAVFDNDGTLWSEYPVYFQVYFILDRIKELAADNPEWKQKEPFASVLKGDLKAATAGGKKARLEMVAATHAGMSSEEFSALVSKWITTARHPQTQKLYTEMVYQPMLELLDYLRSQGFKTYIVSGGGVAFMRPWVEEVYGIPPEQVVGSRIKSVYELQDGKPVIMRTKDIEFVDDKAGKPVGIYVGIGRRPIMAFGNSDGDLQMLQWATGGDRPGFAGIVHHTDAEREAAYDRDSHVGKLDEALDEAKKKDWTVIDMKKEWKTVHPAQP